MQTEEKITDDYRLWILRIMNNWKNGKRSVSFQCAAAGRKWYGDQAGISGRLECVDGAGDDEHDERSAVASEFGAALKMYDQLSGKAIQLGSM